MDTITGSKIKEIIKDSGAYACYMSEYGYDKENWEMIDKDLEDTTNKIKKLIDKEYGN